MAKNCMSEAIHQNQAMLKEQEESHTLHSGSTSKIRLWMSVVGRGGAPEQSHERSCLSPGDASSSDGVPATAGSTAA